MSRATYIIGDTLAVLPTLDPGSVDLVVTSPPFLALRSYLPAGHADKPLEHGSEPTPAAFLAQLLDVTELLGRALAPHGSLAIELGDTYSSEGGITDNRVSSLGGNDLVPRAQRGGGRGWPLPKSLCFVPSLYAASLAYGRNLLALPGTAEWREFQPWRVRNLIAWVRPNPPVGALGDKWRPATSYITVATRSATRYWDDIPTRKPMAESTAGRAVGYRRSSDNKTATSPTASHGRDFPSPTGSHPAGAPLLDWWEITPTGFTSRLGAHYATFPDQIAIPLVEAMCPRRVCRTCGTPSRRQIKDLDAVGHRPISAGARAGRKDGTNGVRVDMNAGPDVSRKVTVGWSTCGCPGTEHTREDGYHEGPGWRPGLVLDPYCGTGTTLLVATGHGRDAIGIDLDARNAALAEERIGMFLTIKEPAA